MGWIIGINFFNIAVTICLRMLLRSEIKRKAWKKHASGNRWKDWFLWSFQQEKGRKFFVRWHFILTIANVVVFMLSLLLALYGVTEIVLLPLLVSVVAILSVLWTLTLRIKRPIKQQTVFYDASDWLFLLIATVIAAGFYFLAMGAIAGIF